MPGEECVDSTLYGRQEPTYSSLRLDMLLDPARVVLLDKIQWQSLVGHEAERTTAQREECRPPVGIGNSVEEATDLLAIGLIFVGHASRVTSSAVKADPIDGLPGPRDKARNLGENISGPAGRLGLTACQRFGEGRRETECRADRIGSGIGEGLIVERNGRRNQLCGAGFGQQRNSAKTGKRTYSFTGAAIDHRLVQTRLLHGAVRGKLGKRVAVGLDLRLGNAGF